MKSIIFWLVILSLGFSATYTVHIKNGNNASIQYQHVRIFSLDSPCGSLPSGMTILWPKELTILEQENQQGQSFLNRRCLSVNDKEEINATYTK